MTYENNQSSGRSSNNGNRFFLTIILPILVVAVVLFGIYASMSNKLVSLQQDVDYRWSQVENVMQRRADLIPNVVATVKGEMNHETEVISKITEARAMFKQAADEANSSGDTEAVNKARNKQMEANAQLSSGLSTLVNAIHEDYPQLESSSNVTNLITELEGSENRISVERKRYIDAVLAYNKAVQSFPTSTFAGMKGMKTMDYYKASAGAEQAPKVEF